VQPFLERVVGHLERVQRVAGKEVVDAVGLDGGQFEAFVIRLFEQIPDTAGTPARPSTWRGCVC
jgi:hypothetical protein